MNTEEKKNITEKRPPIVVVLGHVDHGKSTLLDYIRKTNVVEKEAGGITQHISAYEVLHKTKEGEVRHITFLDTPGHEAFSHMRARGANLADIAILVISGEDGVKEQTLEVLKTLKESKIPYVVVATKMDKPAASPDRVKQGLAEHEVFVEGYGGTVPFVEVSAKTGAGIPELLDIILLLADIADLKGSRATPAEGVIIESHIDPRQGISAAIVITNGTLKTGTCLVAGNSYAPVRAINAFLDHKAKEASFSSPVIITGFNKIPPVGTAVQTYESKKEALACTDRIEAAEKETRRKQAPSGNGEEKTFFIPVVIKADTAGSLEALQHEIKKLNREKELLNVVYAGIGPIEEGDVKRALGSKDAIILGFNVALGRTAEHVALQKNIPIKTFDIIYKLTEWLAEEAKKRAPKTLVEEQVGTARILKLFGKTKGRQIVGGRVLEGEMVARGKIKILRRGKEIDRGDIIELQQQKNRVGKVEKGLEFGALIESKHELVPSDTIEAFVMVEK